VSGLILLLAACAAPVTEAPRTEAPLEPTATPAAQLSPATPTPTPVPAGTQETYGAEAGWRLDGEPRHYDRETLYDLVDGAADLYFSYGFEEVTVAPYAHESGQAVQVELYTMASDADAYGLYTYHSYGEAVDLGVDGEREPGYRLAFWQDGTFVQIVAREAVDDEALWALGQAVAASLPEGGARPAVVGALPAEGLQPGSVRFFREKIALDNLLWLGTDDLLGLGPDVEGVVARYEVDGQTADLLLVAYPDAERAQQARAALEGGQVEGLIATGIGERVLGAVFGSLSAEAAETLLTEAIESTPGD